MATIPALWLATTTTTTTTGATSTSTTSRLIVSKWLLAEDPIAIMIRNREIFDEFRNFFNVLWEHAQK